LGIEAGVGDRSTTGSQSDDECESEEFISERFHNG